MIKSIDTYYRGRLFRSRLEARWAIFFDALSISWSYEEEGYRVEGFKGYLPDFKLITPQGRTRWVEIKPSATKEDPKFEAFSRSLSREEEAAGAAVLVSGSPLEWLEGKNSKERSICPRCGIPSEEPWGESFYCFPCDLETPCGGPHPWQANGILGAKWTVHDGTFSASSDDIRQLKELTKKAAIKAQCARFEHGENNF